ncbi:amidase family protein [Diplocarpon rosae]|nr:amidase family protein [Diplocarpon rosae]
MISRALVLSIGLVSRVMGTTLADVDRQLLESPYPYEFPVFPTGADATSGQFPMPPCHGFPLEEATIDQLNRALARGELTSVQMVTCSLQRIRQTDEYISSVMEINPDVLEIAASLDRERQAGQVRGPLHGIPFLVKDNIATQDKMETTAGSWMLLGAVVPRDADVVRRLRGAGAVLLGHAGMSEWADMRSTLYSEGYSARGGQCRSPYNLTMSPGGSSSGSATAIAANYAMFSLGTETDGSIISPAARNAVVGIKPTVGLTSRAGVIPESHNLDTVGCFARTVRDATYCLDGIYGPDPRDNYTSLQQTPPTGYAPYLTTRSSLRGMSFGIPWRTFWQYAPPSQVAPLLALIHLLEAAGATIYNHTDLPSRARLVNPASWDWDYGTKRGFANESEYTVVKTDFYNDIAAYLAELHNTDIRSLADIMAYNVANVGTEGGIPGVHPAFAGGQDGFEAAWQTGGGMDETYWQAWTFMRQAAREEGIDAALDRNGTRLTALLVPSDLGQVSNVAAQAGYPLITLPAGVSREAGLPFGLGLMGTAWSESVLVGAASAIEDLQRHGGAAGELQRTAPKWYEWRAKNIPVLW